MVADASEADGAIGAKRVGGVLEEISSWSFGQPESESLEDLRAVVLKSAEYYAARGIPIFPVRADKHPLVNWGTEATLDAGQIREWWKRWPNAMIGAPTGRRGGFVVIDVDRNNGIDGFETLRTKGFWIPPGTVEVTTPSGGAHYYFDDWSDPVGTSAGKMGLGIDVRGDSGCIILPPSCPQFGGPSYRFAKPVSGGAHISRFPDWAYLRAPTTRPRATVNSTSQYGREALEDECRRVSQAAEGTRNDTLNEASFAIGQLCAGGAIDEWEAREELSRAASELLTRKLAQPLKAGSRAVSATRAVPARMTRYLPTANSRLSRRHSSWGMKMISLLASGFMAGT